MTTLDDERMDQRLRRAGERLRHEAPSAAATSDAVEAVDSMPPPPRRAARWVAPAVVAAVAASIIALLVFVGTRDDVVEERPADLPFIPPGEVSAHLYAVDYDGAGGNCVALVGQDGIPAQGCLAGDQDQLGRAVVTVVDGDLRTIVSPGHTNVHGQEDDSCFDDVAEANEGRFVDVLTCGGSQPVFGLLPVEPGDETEWFVRDVTGRDAPVDLVTGDGVTYLFEAADAHYRPCRVRRHPAGRRWVGRRLQHAADAAGANGPQRRRLPHRAFCRCAGVAQRGARHSPRLPGSAGAP